MVYITFIFFLLLNNYNSLHLGVIFLMCVVRVSVFMVLKNRVFQSLLFFLLYCGGVLVVFVYFFSLQSKPTFLSRKSGVVLLGFLLLKVLKFYFFRDIKKRCNNKNFFHTFGVSGFLELVGFIVLSVLFIVNVFLSAINKALRPKIV